MKKVLFFILLPILSFGQIQIGSDIDGETENSWSGSSVCLSEDGTTLAIGAFGNNEKGAEAGSVRVYKNVSGIWKQIGADIDGEKFGDGSGASVSLSGDGNVLAIGATGSDRNGSNAGSVRVYKNISGSWIQTSNDIDGKSENDNSGWSVSLSGDGTVLAIGAIYSTGKEPNSGSVSVYKNVAERWIKLGTTIDGVAVGDNTGTSVSLSSDGNVVAISADRSDKNAINAGSVSVYKNFSGIWKQIGATIDGKDADERCGISVMLSKDGNTLAIGAPGNNTNGKIAGCVRIYKNVSEKWEKIGNDINGEAGEYSGSSISLSGDGAILAISALLNENGEDAGLVRVYKNISDTWMQIGININGEAAGDRSGCSISISKNGTTLAIGAMYNSEKGRDKGSVRVYDLSNILQSKTH